VIRIFSTASAGVIALLRAYTSSVVIIHALIRIFVSAIGQLPADSSLNV
jgi:hypothetical protein